MDNLLLGVKDANLKLTLAFGCGLHHAGLQEKDRKIVEELFVNQKIQVGYLIFQFYDSCYKFCYLIIIYDNLNTYILFWLTLGPGRVSIE